MTSINQTEQGVTPEMIKAVRDKLLSGDASPDDLGGSICTMTLRNPDGIEAVRLIDAMLSASPTTEQGVTQCAECDGSGDAEYIGGYARPCECCHGTGERGANRISPETIAEWRSQQGEGMNSAIGEYVPEEFLILLDAYEALTSGAVHDGLTRS